MGAGLPDEVDVFAIYEDLDEQGLLEDRREYALDDWAKAYPHLTEQDCRDLMYLVQRDFDPERVSPYGLEDRYDPRIVVETITEALHQDLDGWNPRQKVTIEQFLDDLALAVKGIAEDRAMEEQKKVVEK